MTYDLPRGIEYNYARLFASLYRPEPMPMTARQYYSHCVSRYAAVKWLYRRHEQENAK